MCSRHAGKSVLIEPLDAPADRWLVLTGDATDEASRQDAVDRTIAAFGGLDASVTNAGVIGIGPVVEMSFAEWRRVVETNLHSVFLGARAAARRMVAQGRGGSIINASSGAGRKGAANLAPYCASKSAIIMLTQAMAVELAPHWVRVNAYAPGHIETPFRGRHFAGFRARHGQDAGASGGGFCRKRAVGPLRHAG